MEYRRVNSIVADDILNPLEIFSANIKYYAQQKCSIEKKTQKLDTKTEV